MNLAENFLSEEDPIDFFRLFKLSPRRGFPNMTGSLYGIRDFLDLSPIVPSEDCPARSLTEVTDFCAIRGILCNGVNRLLGLLTPSSEGRAILERLLIEMHSFDLDTLYCLPVGA